MPSPASSDRPSTWTYFFPTAYLRDYDGHISQDERTALTYLVELFRREVRQSASLLDFGCGPTIHRVMAAAPYVENITLADLLPGNLKEVEHWLSRDSLAYDWSHYTRFLLEIESAKPARSKDIIAREDLTRHRIKTVLQADALEKDPLGSNYRNCFDIVMSCFALEMAGQDAKSFQTAFQNVLGLVSPDGLAIIMCLKACSFYSLGSDGLECYPVVEDDIIAGLLKATFTKSINIETHAVPEHKEQGYTEIILASARRNGQTQP